MKRLTFYDDFGRPCYRLNGCVYQNKIAERLAAYEDAEEQGRLVILPEPAPDIDFMRIFNLVMADAEDRVIVLPCKVEEKLFYNFLGKTYEGTLTKVVYHEAGVQVYFADYDGDNASRRLDEVFKTREEAEKALEEMR